MSEAQAVLAREQLKIRAKLIELAAILDRIDRADGEVDQDPHLQEIKRSLNVLLNSDSDSNRAAEIQLIYSRAFDVGWKKKFKLN